MKTNRNGDFVRKMGRNVLPYRGLFHAVASRGWKKKGLNTKEDGIVFGLTFAASGGGLLRIHQTLAILVVACWHYGFGSDAQQIELLERQYDFRNVTYQSESMVLRHSFSMRNIGASAKVVKSVAAGCACAGTTIRKAYLHPREATHIDVSLNIEGIEGSRIVPIRVQFEDDSWLEVRVRVFVAASIYIVPEKPKCEIAENEIGRVEFAAYMTRTSVTNRVDLGKIKLRSGWEGASFRICDVKTGDRGTRTGNVNWVMYLVEGKLPWLRNSQDRAEVLAEFWNGQEVRIPIEINARAAACLSPDAIFCGRVKKGATCCRIVRLKAYGNSDIETIECDNKEFRFDVLGKNASDSTEILATMPWNVAPGFHAVNGTVIVRHGCLTRAPFRIVGLVE